MRYTRLHGSVICVLLVFASTGCVRRRMTIRSNPPGAMVFIDEQQIGTTPVSTNFTYYGARNIRLIKDGFETVNVVQTFPAPWYQVPPLDLVSENLVSREIRDEHVVDFNMQPQRIVPTEELLSRANNLRQNSRAGIAAPMPVMPRVVSPVQIPPAVPSVTDAAPPQPFEPSQPNYYNP